LFISSHGLSKAWPDDAVKAGVYSEMCMAVTTKGSSKLAMRVATVSVIAGVMITSASSAPSASASAWHNNTRDRADVVAEITSLKESLIAGRSASVALEAWCAKYEMANPPRIVAEYERGIDKPVAAKQRQLLGVGPDQPIKYRRVRLTCGTHVLSKADNWYVPGRLTAAMNRQLETSDVPFGLVVRSLHPVRLTLSITRIWSPRAQDPIRSGWLVMPSYLFRLHALVLDNHRRPLAEVIENYTGEALTTPIRPARRRTK
jgi:hypothetical protein